MAGERSAIGRIWDHLKQRVGAMPGEIGQMIDHKMSQGAAELGQGLNSQADAYVPYGTGQKPLEVEGPGMNYQDMLKDASQRAGHEHDQGIDR